MRRILPILAVSLFSIKVGATVTIASVTGNSGFSNTGQAVIYGGTAGPDCSNGTTIPCNSCPAAATTGCTNSTGTIQTPLCACNQARITDNTVLSIALTNNPAVTTGQAIATMAGAIGSTTNNALQPVTPANGGSFFDVKWLTVCQAITAGASCTALANGSTGTITICIDKNLNSLCDNGEDSVTVTVKIVNPGTDYNIFGVPNQDGVGGFSPYPGDGKAFIENIASTGTFPNLGYTSTIIAARIFISDVSMDKASPVAPFKTTDFTVTSDGLSFDQSSATDLNNGQLYYIRMAMIDQASNVVQFFPGNIVASDFGGLGAHCLAGDPTPKLCPFAVTPDQVLGLLTKDVNCFIATAAYGSSLEPKLTVFRDFRNRVLLQKRWGQAFVLSYYLYGPYAARFIADKPILRAFVRAALWPLYGFSWLALRIGLTGASALLVSLLALLLAGPWMVRLRRPNLRA